MKRHSITALAALLMLPLSASASMPYEAGSDEDPRVRAALYLGADDRHYSAVSELLKVQKGAAASEFEAAPGFWSALAEFYLSFGMRDRSEELYRSVAAAAADPLLSGKARLRVAEFEYERGYLDESRASLLRAREKLPESLLPLWSDLYSRVLMGQGRYNEAVEILEKSDTRDDDGYLRYNLGVALINDGRVAQGRTALDRVGRLQANDENEHALRDKANVTLGWHFLQKQLGASAKPVFARVRSEGPFSNRALLGIGWAEIAPGGARQTRAELPSDSSDYLDPVGNFSGLGVLLRRGYLDDPYERTGLRTFRRAKIADEEEVGLQRALAAWAELIDRDPQDPSVQESWLAVPFALDRLGAHTQAAQYYEQAAERLDAARKRTVAAIEAIRGGRMVETMVRADDDAEAGWDWELRDLPNAPETYYLQTLIAEHNFAERLKNYRDIRMLSSNLESWRSRIEQMESAYRQTDRDTVDPTIQFGRAKRNWKPPAERLSLNLTEALSLSPPGQFSAKIEQSPPPAPELRASVVPAKFEGPYERLQSLKQRVDGLAKPLADARTEGARQLRKLAFDELTAQKRTIEKYLVECRFALARLYDREPPTLDQDEFEIENGKAPVKLPRGEFEIDKDKPLDAQINKPRPKPAPRRSAEPEEVEVK